MSVVFAALRGFKHHVSLKRIVNYIRNNQCLGTLLLKVMCYNIALLSKKVTDYVT